jgi:hypothetical protein
MGPRKFLVEYQPRYNAKAPQEGLSAVARGKRWRRARRRSRGIGACRGDGLGEYSAEICDPHK